MNRQPADLILHNGKIATQDDRRSLAEAAAIRDGKFLAVGTDREVMRLRDDSTKLIDLNKRTVIPGLNDSHLHLIRGGLNYNLELRWDGVPSLADGLRMLREQAQRTPAGQWVRVVGGWSEFQFAERRMPTLDELNRAAPDTPVFVLHLYDRALLNRAALRAVGYTKDSPNPPGGEIVRDARGNPTGILIAQAERDDPVLHARQGPETAAGISGQLEPPLHAGAESAGDHQRHRRRRRISELSGRLSSHRAASQEWRVDGPDCLQSVYPEAQGANSRISNTGPACSNRGRATITFATMARVKCWSFRPRISRTFWNRGRTCLGSWSRN